MLYKYLPRRFAEALINRGEVLFRGLSYFRAVEHVARGDEIEGVHVDAPDHDVTLEDEYRPSNRRPASISQLDRPRPHSRSAAHKTSDRRSLRSSIRMRAS